MHRSIILLAAILILPVIERPALAQSLIQVSGAQATYVFGEYVDFTARLQAASAVRETMICIQVEGELEAITSPVTMNPDGNLSFRYIIQQHPLRPFARIFYWYQVTLQSGETQTSQQFYFEYIDNRFPWQTLEDTAVRVHWYSGDINFGQTAFNVAHVAMQEINAYIPATSTEPIEIYIYASPEDVQNVLNLGGQSWVAGHVNPNLGAVIAAILPGAGQENEIERQIPSAMVHVMLYRYASTRYDSFPEWLREGLAAQAELNPNPDYQNILSIASETQSLLPISELCSSFPTDASRAYLALAESSSLVNYVHKTFGAEGVQALINAYAGGMDCAQGLEFILGVPLTQLEQRWKQSELMAGAAGFKFLSVLPFLIILVAILAIPAWQIRSKRKARNDFSRSK